MRIKGASETTDITRHILTGTISRANKQIKAACNIFTCIRPLETSASPPQLFQAILLLSVSSYQSEEVQGGQGLQIAGYHTERTSLSPTSHIAQPWLHLME